MKYTNIVFYEVADMRNENNEPTCYAVLLNNIRIGYITLFTDGWHIEQEEEEADYRTLLICKTLSSAKRKAQDILTTDMIMIRNCHRLTRKEIISAVNQYKIKNKIDLVHYLVGYYGYIDTNDLAMIRELSADGELDTD